MTKRWEAFAFSGGWAEQPLDYFEAITALDIANDEWDSEEREKRQAERQTKKASGRRGR